MKSEGRVLYVDHCETEALRAIWSKDKAIDHDRIHVDVAWRAGSFREALDAYAASADDRRVLAGLD